MKKECFWARCNPCKHDLIIQHPCALGFNFYSGCCKMHDKNYKDWQEIQEAVTGEYYFVFKGDLNAIYKFYR